MQLETLLVVHGAGRGPELFDGWADDFPGVETIAVDLQDGLDVARASLADYAAAIVRAAAGRSRPLAVCAWSLGGLAAMLAAAELEPEALVLLEPSPPAEIQGLHPDVVPQPGTFEPDPGRRPGRPESSLAYGQRQRGVSVPSLPASTRTLVVFGDEFRKERGPRLAAFYGAEALDAGAATHWDLVLDPAVRRRVAAWLAGAVCGGQREGLLGGPE